MVCYFADQRNGCSIPGLKTGLIRAGVIDRRDSGSHPPFCLFVSSFGLFGEARSIPFEGSLDGAEKVGEEERFPEHGGADFADELVVFGIGLVAGHEDEPAAEMWFCSFYSQIKHVTRQVRHHEVAQNNIKVPVQDVAKPIGAIRNPGDPERVRTQKYVDHLGEFNVVLEHEDAFRRLWGGLLFHLINPFSREVFPLGRAVVLSHKAKLPQNR